MIKNNSWGIKQRAIFLALTPSVTIAIALTSYFLFLRYGDVDAALLSRGAALARQLAPAAEYGAFSGNRVELQRLLNSAASEEDVVAIGLHDSAGKLLAIAGNFKLEGDVSILPDGWHGFINDGNIVAFHAKIHRQPLVFDDPFHLPEATQTTVPAKLLGSVTLEMTRARLVARKWEILLVTLTAAFSVLAAAVLLARRLGRDITEPVLALESAVEQLRSGNLDARAPRHPSGTLSSLEIGFNEMATALAESQQCSETRLSEAHRELLIKKEEAEHASQAKSRFLVATSHDLRQPLHALTLFATELETMAATSEQQRLSAQIGTAAGAMGELLDALLDVSRLDTGDIVPHRQSVALGPLLENIVAAHRQSTRAKGLRLKLRSTTAWVDTDPHLLRRMLGNLIANAVRYTQQGGVLVGVRRRGSDVRIEVWDSGIGIDSAHLPHLFQEFYQVSNPERDAAKGLGLGLAITDHLGRILGHRIDVQSRLGHGSRFSITLPGIVPGKVEETSLTAPLGARIQVASMDNDIRRNLCDRLVSWGYQAVPTKSWHPPKDALDTSPPDLVILDDECLEATPSMPANAYRQPAVLLGNRPENPLSAPLDIIGHLPKPPRPAQLRSLLHHLLVENNASEGENISEVATDPDQGENDAPTTP